VKRINIGYNGQVYSIGEVDLETLRARITAAASGRTEWLTVNYGEGRPQVAEILIGPGIPIALMPVPDPEA
jgi:hypothetical protein